MADPAYLPGTFMTQQTLNELLAQAPLPYSTWYPFLYDLHPAPLPEVPIWYVTVVTNALKAGHVSDSQAKALLTNDLTDDEFVEPQRLHQAWASLTQAMAVTWPKRRKATASAITAMNLAVRRARRAALRG